MTFPRYHRPQKVRAVRRYLLGGAFGSLFGVTDPEGLEGGGFISLPGFDPEYPPFFWYEGCGFPEAAM